ncbi:helix-turn-helix domain-containing protein [Pontimicrobium sp. SW4]|uniref:Helix-turn-helix domain-containing protein n=1 Tax=Pontimicrobium sp. SW4 TaxID=3153519 RepID=A0AAU7BQV2_9FLAO
MNLLIFVIGYATIQSLLLIYLLSTAEGKRNKGIYYLISLLLVTTFIVIQYMLTELGYRENYRAFFMLGFSPMFLIPPLYFLFCSSNLNYKKFSLKTALHFLPFIFFSSIMFIGINTPTLKKVIFSSLVIQLLSYSIVSFKLLGKGKKEDIEPTKVLKFLTICMLLFAIIVFLEYLAIIVFEIKSIDLISIVTVFLIGFITILEVHLIKGFSTSFDFTVFQVKKYKNSNLQSQNLEELDERLNILLSQEKIFLTPNLKAEDLADKLAISRHQLTEFLNQELECSFNDLMNKHRVDYVKKDLLNIDKKHLSISGLANEAGFKSTATFYRAFKAQTGFTPSEYIKNHS